MADEEGADEAPKKKGLMVPILIGAVLALALGGGGFYAVSSGLLLGGGAEAKVEDGKNEVAEKAAFVALEPLVVSLGGTDGRQLRFTGQLEVAYGKEADVTAVLPRIMDVLNGYLRAIDSAEVLEPATMVRARAQMLRRVQIIVGDGLVKDLLVMEFVLT